MTETLSRRNKLIAAEYLRQYSENLRRNMQVLALKGNTLAIRALEEADACLLAAQVLDTWADNCEEL
ncbi:hypothetical protein N6L27_07255 [Leisingera sp. SS27]|uniref:hypothetical protein n=1 Tax=Leisingera sp. SS27 TaxID=2979462 RepID=UPI00232DB7C4|nr:hypothetical protein [Leisingera sp. SS27]MDC0657788.1 hypothetical protein [Leisingera sp. SS27]